MGVPLQCPALPCIALHCPVLPCRRQDEDLDHLSSHVVRIGELGKEMGQELHLQARKRWGCCRCGGRLRGGCCCRCFGALLWLPAFACRCPRDKRPSSHTAASTIALRNTQHFRPLQGHLLDELDQEIEGTSTRIQAAQKKVRPSGRGRARCVLCAAGLMRPPSRLHALPPTLTPALLPSPLPLSALLLCNRWSTC